MILNIEFEYFFSDKMWIYITKSKGWLQELIKPKASMDKKRKTIKKLQR